MFELSKTGNQNVINLVEYRSEIKTLLDEFYSVQFFLKRKGIFYQFKLRTTSSNRPCILVKEESPVFTELQVGDILDMEYINPQSSDANSLFKTQITTKNAHDFYTGHSIIGLSIIDFIGEMTC